MAQQQQQQQQQQQLSASAPAPAHHAALLAPPHQPHPAHALAAMQQAAPLGGAPVAIPPMGQSVRTMKVGDVPLLPPFGEGPGKPGQRATRQSARTARDTWQATFGPNLRITLEDYLW
jgi:hypothetical protein